MIGNISLHFKTIGANVYVLFSLLFCFFQVTIDHGHFPLSLNISRELFYAPHIILTNVYISNHLHKMVLDYSQCPISISYTEINTLQHHTFLCKSKIISLR